MRRLQTMRRVVDQVRAQARRADKIAEQLAKHGLMYGPEMRHQARIVGQWADILEGRLDRERDPRGAKRTAVRRRVGL